MVDTVKKIIDPLRQLKWHWSSKLFEYRLDKKFGINTRGKADIDWNLSSNLDAVGYAATRYVDLQRIAQYLNLSPDDVFVDYGSGKGRVVLFMSMQKIKKAIGLEIDPILMRETRKNIKTFEDKYPQHSPVEFIEGEAMDFDPAEGTVFFFYNPFGEKTFQKIVNNIERSLQKNPRRILILYKNAKEKKLLDEASWLTPLGQIEKTEIFVWRNI